MKVIKSLLLATFLLVFNISDAGILKIKVLGAYYPKAVIFKPENGNYAITSNEQLICSTSQSEVLQFSAVPEGIQIKSLEKDFGIFPVIKVESAGQKNEMFKLKSAVPDKPVHTYRGGLTITVQGGSLKIINHVDIEDYVAGVVEAESGSKAPIEYYKLQSILCRTYALSHVRRHEKEGFELCDRVHCQVYRGIPTHNDSIVYAVKSTKGMVIVDNNLELITAAFHSNCGGSTMNSEHVWTLPLPYLKAVKDTFCQKQPHAQWEKRIEKDKWLSYLRAKYKYNLQDSMHYQCAINFPQDERKVYFAEDNRIPLKYLRSDWGLRSTYFSISEEEDTVIFKGKGFGHGVGLCQEGAMRMAEFNYSYTDIIHHYFTNVNMVNLTALRFFLED